MTGATKGTASAKGMGDQRRSVFGAVNRFGPSLSAVPTRRSRAKPDARARLLRLAAAAARAGLATVRALAVAAVVGVVLLAFFVPRAVAGSRPARRFVKERLLEGARAAATTPLRSAAAFGLGLLLFLNGTVRVVGGGDPDWLSTQWLSEKAEAVGRLALHLPAHVFGRCRAPLDFEAPARKERIAPQLIWAVAYTESRLKPHAISHAGAMGLMQLMPATAARLRVADPFDPRQSLDGGARFLGELSRRYGGDIERIAAAYHAGPGAVAVRGPLRVGPRTRRYSAAVGRRYREALASSSPIGIAKLH